MRPTTTTDQPRPTRRQILRRRWVLAILATALVIAGAMFANYHLASVPRKADARAYTAGWLYGDGAALNHTGTADTTCPTAYLEAPAGTSHARAEAGCRDAFAEVAAGR